MSAGDERDALPKGVGVGDYGGAHTDFGGVFDILSQRGRGRESALRYRGQEEAGMSTYAICWPMITPSFVGASGG
jgi:hypothetical protein